MSVSFSRKRSIRFTARPLVLAVHAAMLGGGLCAQAALAADAASAAVSSTVSYNVPAGSLERVLNGFASASGIVLSFDPQLTAGKTSKGLSGNYSTALGFASLLSGTGLQAVPVDGGYALLPVSSPVTAREAAGTVVDEATTLGTVVVSAAGFEQKLTDAPASISVVTQEDLVKKPYLTLLDVVRDIEGVDVGENVDKSGNSTISIRGMGADNTLILVDGKRQSNHGDIYPNNTLGGTQFSHLPPLDAIERVEIIRGPASTLYGADALGGLINIITKKVTDKWTGSLSHSRTWQSDDEFGDDRTTDFNVMGPLIKGKLGLSLRGSLYDRDASVPTYASATDPNGHVLNPSSAGIGGNNAESKTESIGGRLTWTPTDKQTIWLEADTSRLWYDNSQGSAGGIGTMASQGIWNGRSGYKEDQDIIRNSWSMTHEGKWDIGTSLVSLAHISTDNRGRELPLTAQERRHLQAMTSSGAYTAPDGTVYDYAGMSLADRQQAAVNTFLPRPDRKLESTQYTLDAKLDIPVRDFYGDHVVVVGGQVIRGKLEDGVFGMESGRSGGHQEHNMYSLFVEDSWNVIDPLVVTTGVRYDDHETFGSNVSPRLYGVYTIDNSWTVKGGVSTGFKTPRTTDLVDGITGYGGQGTSPWVGNPDLKPETSRSSELALYWQHPVKRHNANITLFQTTYEDKIESVTVPACGVPAVQPCANLGDYATLGFSSTASKKVNIRNAEIRGVELAGRYQISPVWALRGNYTYTDSEQKDGTAKGRPLTNVAKHMANATLDWQTTDKLNLFLNVEARDKRNRTTTATAAAANGSEYYKGYEVLHLGAAYKVNKTVTLHARVNNLLDEDFTTYYIDFIGDNNGDGDMIDTGEYTKVDDYNNKDKRRSFWLGINVRF